MKQLIKKSAALLFFVCAFTTGAHAVINHEQLRVIENEFTHVKRAVAQKGATLKYYKDLKDLEKSLEGSSSNQKLYKEIIAEAKIVRAKLGISDQAKLLYQENKTATWIGGGIGVAALVAAGVVTCFVGYHNNWFGVRKSGASSTRKDESSGNKESLSVGDTGGENAQENQERPTSEAKSHSATTQTTDTSPTFALERVEAQWKFLEDAIEKIEAWKEDDVATYEPAKQAFIAYIDHAVNKMGHTDIVAKRVLLSKCPTWDTSCLTWLQHEYDTRARAGDFSNRSDTSSQPPLVSTTLVPTSTTTSEPEQATEEGQEGLSREKVKKAREFFSSLETNMQQANIPSVSKDEELNLDLIDSKRYKLAQEICKISSTITIGDQSAEEKALVRKCAAYVVYVKKYNQKVLISMFAILCKRASNDDVSSLDIEDAKDCIAVFDTYFQFTDKFSISQNDALKSLFDDKHDKFKQILLQKEWTVELINEFYSSLIKASERQEDEQNDQMNFNKDEDSEELEVSFEDENSFTQQDQEESNQTSFADSQKDQTLVASTVHHPTIPVYHIGFQHALRQVTPEQQVELRRKIWENSTKKENN